MKTFDIIAAYSNNRGIGLDNKLPWESFRSDFKHFVKVTKTVENPECQNAIIMGRKTWESLPKKPLKKRFNVILSSTLKNNKDNENVIICTSLSKALEICNNKPKIENIFVIGGQQLYTRALDEHKFECNKIYITEIDKFYKADTYFPEIPKFCKLINKTTIKEKNVDLHFKTYQNMSNLKSEEYQYLNCLKDILDHGEYYNDRTKVGVLSVFDVNLNFKIDTLKDNKYRIPMLTTKKMFSRGIIVELLWFLRGNTNVKWLQDRNVHIWDGNSTREFLDNKNLDYPTGQIGPCYGHQWINWGGDWNSKEETGINQIKNIIHTLKTNPTSRRIVCRIFGDII